MPLTFNAGNVKTISGACKIIEIILLLVTMMIQRTTGSLFGGEDAHIFSMGLLVTGLIITPILLLCYIVDRDITRSSVIEPVLNITLFGLFLIAAVLCLIYWESHIVVNDSTRRLLGISLGCFTLFASIAYLVDGIHVCRLYFQPS
ncbi:uncharacterized protein [Cherax quadricarinatus]